MSSISQFPTMKGVIRPAIKVCYPTLRTHSQPQLLLLHPTLYPLQRYPFQRHHGQQPSSRRYFHISPTIGTVLQGTQDLILSFHHATATPWIITIPLVALGVTMLFRLPLTIYTRKIQQRRVQLLPILQAWHTRIQRAVELERSGEALSPTQRKAEVETRFNRTTARIWRKFGLQEWKLYANVLGLPFWLVGIDAIRRLCGGPRGILGSLFLGSGGGQEADSATAEIAKTVRTEAQTAGDGLIAAATTTADTLTGSGTDITAAMIAHTTAEPSLTTGGILWFPDLTVADPWHVLPLALSAIFIVNLWPKTVAGRQAVFNMDSGDPSDSDLKPNPNRSARTRLGLHRGLFITSFLIGPITMDFPAALHLYWISSSALSWGTQKMLDRLYPVKGNAVKLCKGIELPVIRPKRDAVVQVSGGGKAVKGMSSKGKSNASPRVR